MKNSLALAIVLLVSGFTFGQEIPNGVRYKKASDAINNTAKANLERALASESVPQDFFAEPMVIGPMLWRSLKPSADQVLLRTMSISLVVSGSSVAEAKRIATNEERSAFWKLFRGKFANIKDGKVRKGNAQEISYYWAQIPFDIEEPFWVVESGGDRFIANFSMKDGQRRLFWFDLVGDLQTFRN